MNAKPLLAAPLLAIALATPAQAATKRQAQKAVLKEMRQQYDLHYSTATCVKLTSRRFRCRWDGYTEQDISDGNVEGWKGTARVVYFGRRADVTLHVTVRGD